MMRKVDSRQYTEDRMNRRATPVLVAFCILYTVFCILLSSCTQSAAPTTRPLSTRERQDRAIKDPFNYSPDSESTDISGGGLSDFDKGGFKKDLKNATNP